MSNFDENNQEEIANFILENLPRHRQFALGTTDEAGRPWVVCLNLAFNDELKFIWKSRMDTEHSKHIAKRPEVSICVFSETEETGDFGLYTNAIAREVSDEAELLVCLDTRYVKKGKKAPLPAELSGDSPERIYSADIKEAWVNDDRHLKVKVDLGILRNAAKQR